MEYVFILLIITSIGYAIYWFFSKLYRVIFRVKKPEKPIKPVNPYVFSHELKLRNDRYYEEYLDFCAKKGEIPMDKEGFEEMRKAEQQIQDLLK